MFEFATTHAHNCASAVRGTSPWCLFTENAVCDEVLHEYKSALTRHASHKSEFIWTAAFLFDIDCITFDYNNNSPTLTDSHTRTHTQYAL